MEPKFKVGDRVRFTSSSVRAGDLAVVLRFDDYGDLLPYFVELEGSRTCEWCFPNELERVDTENPPDEAWSPTDRRTHTLPVDSAERKNFPLHRGLMRYCPAALAGVAMVSKLGNDKHNPGAAELHHDRSKSTDHADCIARHQLDLDADYGKGVGRDEHGVPQVLYTAWRALMQAQEWLEEHDGAPRAPAATNVKE